MELMSTEITPDNRAGGLIIAAVEPAIKGFISFISTQTLLIQLWSDDGRRLP